MLLAVLVQWAGIWQKLLFQINQSEESSKITINAHTTSCPLRQLPITSAAHYNRIYSTQVVISEQNCCQSHSSVYLSEG